MPLVDQQSSTWIRSEDTKSTKYWYHRLCEWILKSGPVPKHVAFIMDGNRRYAQKNSMDRAQGHLMGFDKLTETLQWCLDLGITEVTVYAFSIENFKRSKEEVDGLMELARQKFTRLMQERELIHKHGVCFRVLGNLSLLPRDIQEIIAEAVHITKHNSRAILNICFAYTSREEICTAMREVGEGVQLGLIRESDISEPLLEKCLYTNRSPNPDLLLRTSGEVRLSDFLLWQTAFSVLSFMPVLWPEFSIWHLYAGVLHYQRNVPAVRAARESNDFEVDRLQKESDLKAVTEEIEADKSKGEYNQSVTLAQRLQTHASERQGRIDTFLEHINAKRTSYFEELLKHRKDLSSTSSSVS